MSRYQPHSERIVLDAIERIFDLPPTTDHRFIEGVLTGYSRALTAIGSPPQRDQVARDYDRLTRALRESQVAS